MNPEECKFTKEHEWVYIEDGDTAIIGISDYAAGELGDIVYIELPDAGTKVTQMDPMGTIEAVKTVADLYSPVTGEVIEVNDKAVSAPEVVNKSPYDQGWFLKIRIDDPSELDVLFSYDEYRDFLGEQESTKEGEEPEDK
jgi:glycine cleavage system H protein